MIQFKRLILLGFMVLVFIVVAACSSSNDSSTADHAWSESAGAPSSKMNQMEVDLDATSVSFSTNSANRVNNESGAPPVADATSGTSAIGFAPGAMNQKLIYKANLNLEVESYGETQTEIRNLT